jgi:hypothetical protein
VAGDPLQHGVEQHDVDGLVRLPLGQVGLAELQVPGPLPLARGGDHVGRAIQADH